MSPPAPVAGSCGWRTGTRARAPRGERAALAAPALLVAALVVLVPRAALSGARVTTVRVLAAASLGDAFAEVAREVERAEPGLRVALELGGSQQLAMQVEQGLRADVFASADARWMDALAARGRLDGAPVPFARNRLVVVLPRANPARLVRLQDLARPGLRLVLGADAVPVGRYAREMLARLAARPGFGRDFRARALANVVSEEENVTAVLGKVVLGEADAGIVYRSDVAGAAGRVRVLEIPEPANVIASDRIAVLAGAPAPAAARRFVAAVLSPAGQRALERHGLIPAAPR